MVTGEREATAARARMRPLHYVCLGAVMLEKVEVHRGKVRKGMAEVANDRNSFQENLGQNDGRAGVHVDSPIVQVAKERAKQAKIVKRTLSNGRAASAWMSMRCIGSECDVNGDRRVVAIGPAQQAESGIPGIGRRFDITAKSLTNTDAILHAVNNRGIHFAPGFFRCAEAAVRQDSLDILAGLTAEGDFEIVYGSSSIQAKSCDVAAVHEVQQNGG